MTSNLLIQCVLYIVVLLALAKPLGEFIARVLSGERTFLHPALGWLERLTYKASGVDPAQEMRWTQYAVACLLFNLVGLVAVYALQRLQGVLPLNPASLGAVSPDSSWNTAVSFATNTNWQGYGGESTMSYLTQMLALAVQNFVSAATGIAVLAGADPRLRAPLGGDHRQLLGRPDALDALHPAAALVHPGARAGEPGRGADLRPVRQGATVEKIDYEEPKTGPTASRDRQGRQAGDGEEEHAGADRCRSARPPRRSRSSSSAPTAAASSTSTRRIRYENPTPLSNFLEMLAILLIPAALCITFGRMVGDVRQGWAILAAMTIVIVALLAVAVVAEQSGNPVLAEAGADQQASVFRRRQHGRQGSALRHRQLGALGDRDHRGLQRLGQRDARFLHAARRPGADVADAARRGDLRRRRLRASTA